jgi:hypothetical protein
MGYIASCGGLIGWLVVVNLLDQSFGKDGRNLIDWYVRLFVPDTVVLLNECLTF